MSKIATFLQTLKEQVRVPYSLVSGNQSGDLDSVVSSVSYAYFAAKDDPSQCFVPLLNFRRSELSSRKDIELVFSQLQISKDSLFFVDDLAHLQPPQGLVLVDHNRPVHPLAQYTVTGIIDHHEDEKMFEDVTPRIVQRAGSCSTLVAKYWTGKGASLDDELAKFLVAPLVIDTHDLQSRMEQVDVEMAAKYAEFINPLEMTNWYTEIQEAKLDISGLSTREVLSKDYKQFELGVGTEEIPKKVGISSIVKPYSWLTNQHKDFKHELELYVQEQKLDVLCFMTSFEFDGKFHREFGYVTTDEPSKVLMRLALEKSLVEELQLSKIGDQVYAQLNVAASRKQVAPAIKRALERL